LAKAFEEQFGAVEDAIVMGIQEGDEIKSRGFGFVTFKQDKSVSTAVETHFIIIMGKQVEIKSVIPKCLLTESQKLSAQQHQPKQNDQYEPQAKIPSDQKITEKFEVERMSWVGRLCQGQPNTCSNELQEHISPSFDKSMPAWLRIFVKWLPRHLHDQSTRLNEGDQYALSSLKGDFRATFGLELDHASLGYSKLSDFMKSVPEICRMQMVPIGKCGPATHLVLLPNFPMPHRQLPHTLATPCTPSSDPDSISKRVQNLFHGHQNDSFIDGSTEEAKPAHECPEENSAQNDTLPGVHLRFLEFLKPDPLFHGRSWLQNVSDVDAEDAHGERRGCVEGVKKNHRHQKRHLVLEALCRKRNSTSVFFLGDFDFYKVSSAVN
jgi:hypothetical protein